MADDDDVIDLDKLPRAEAVRFLIDAGFPSEHAEQIIAISRGEVKGERKP